MKQFLFIFGLIPGLCLSANLPFHRGVNLTGWFQVSSAEQIQFTRYTRQDLVNIQSLGCDVIRLPINLHAMTRGAPDYTIDPLFYTFMDQVVDWAEELHLHLILDNHSFDPAISTSPDIGQILLPVWTQLATHYRNRSDILYYEVLNEPHGISDLLWNSIQQDVINAIRAVDSVHTIIVGPASWNGFSDLENLPYYSDPNLIYTFHFYEPFIFTHQGAGWTDPSLVPLAGVPFPFDPDRMPNCPPELMNTYIQGQLDNYQNTGTVQHIQDLLDIAVTFQQERDVPFYCGEFGVYMVNSDTNDRVYWYEQVRQYLEDHNIAWTTWDYQGGFGLFERGSNELFDYDLNVPLVTALGLSAPPQEEFTLRPDSTGFNLYTDYIASGIYQSSWVNGGILNYYAAEPHAGSYCIHWADVNQYSAIGFDFHPDKDLSYLKDNGYRLDFWIKGDTPGTQFEIRFLDTKTGDPDDHPWRMRKIIDENLTAWDSQWHHLQIPLQDFAESGSWDNETWYNPDGKFDWTAIDKCEIVSEEQPLTGSQFWFDDMKILDPNESGNGPKLSNPESFVLFQNYPNPFNPVTTISYSLTRDTKVRLVIYNVLGRKIRTLISDYQEAGLYHIPWNGTNDAGNRAGSGIYFYRLESSDFIAAQKMVLLK